MTDTYTRHSRGWLGILIGVILVQSTMIFFTPETVPEILPLTGMVLMFGSLIYMMKD